MKRYICIVLLLAGIDSFGQRSYNLSAPESTSKTYVARDYIRLLPGFSFNAAGGQTFSASINEHILVNTVYQTTSELPDPNRGLNTSHEVGATAGEAGVGTSGEAMYQIPVAVLSGTGGVQPNISISYNSQSGNGLLGYGWSLNAVSAIARTGKTIYHDGSTAAPQLTASDNLTLDGQRLMRESGTNLAALSKYRTEIETWQEITCKTLNSYLGFEVKNKEGWTLEYGSSADSYIKPAGSSVAYAWLLKKATDANGNYMIYTYDNNAETGEFRLRQIEYTGNAAVGLNPYNKIEFFYETRTDKMTSYIAGKAVEQSVILKRIRCSAYNYTEREYKFNHYYDGFYSKLTEVEEYGENGNRYNSTIVDWGDYASSSSLETSYNISTATNESNSIIQYADFNNDGKTDFICYPNKSSYASSDVAKLFLAGISNGKVVFTQKTTIPLVSGFKKLLITDMNGDGFLDIIRTYQSGNTYYHNLYSFSGETFSSIRTFSSTTEKSWTGDFSGDGKHELVFESQSQVYNYSGVSIGSIHINWGEIFYDFYPNNCYLIDFNGNGKTDILTLNSTGCKVYEFNGSTFSEITTFANSWAKNNGGVLFGDFNEDGRTDLMIQRNNQEYYLLLSTGASFVKQDLDDLNLFSLTLSGNLNKDRKTDFIQLYIGSNYPDGFGAQMYANIGKYNGEEFEVTTVECPGINLANVLLLSNVPVYDSYSDKYIWEPDRALWNLSDFDGDGRQDLIFNTTFSTFRFNSFVDTQQLAVRNIVNGFNQKVSFEYHPITDANYYTATSSSSAFPVSKFRQPLYVTTSMANQSGSIYDTQIFSYKGSKVHRQGKGFLGFEEVITRSSQQDRKTTTQYGYNSSYYNIYPIKQTVTTLSGDSISRINYESNYHTTSVPKVIFPYIQSQTTVDKLIGLTKKIEYDFLSTNHGNPHQIIETQGSLLTTTTNTWVAKNSSYKNRIGQQTVTKTGLGTAFSETRKFEYDSKARLIQQIDYFGHPKAVTTDYGNYDSFGNPRTVTTAATGCPTVTTSVTFDETGRFKKTHTDASGNTSSALYNPRTGAVIERTDIAGLKSYYSYDGFQRVTREQTPFRILYHTINWDASGESVYKTNVNSQLSGDQTVWYNAAGMEVKTQSQGFSGAVVSGKQYNTKGQLHRSYLPGYGSKSSQYVEYAYNSYGLIDTENNLDRWSSYYYSNLETSVMEMDGEERISVFNESGFVQSAMYNNVNQAVTYAYNSLGKPETITSNGLATQIRYDDRGFQRVLKDANLTDSILYEYNAYGQLISQTNARGQTTSFLYDAAGRITQEVRPENTLTFQYVPSGNGIGQIQSIKEGNTTVKSYAYTPSGLPASITETIDNTDYTNSYAYNGYGQMTHRTTPSGMQISYHYTNGILSAMRNAENNALLWQADAVNALGQITESALGNGLKRLTGYDDYHQPNQIALKNGSTFVDRVDYNFDPYTGNLMQRNDITNGRNEAFDYDNLHRLESVCLNNGATNQTSYYPNGNIHTKFDVGTYQYAHNNHAVSGISNKAASYSPLSISLVNTSYSRVSNLILFGSQVNELDLEYGPEKQRRSSRYYADGILQKTMIYTENYEKETVSGGSAKEYDYIYTPEGLSVLAVKTNGARSLYYVHTDHLGSIRVVTNASKGIQSRCYYDAWGKRTLLAGTGITSRGYTGQEHLTDFGLINMNARLYDPALGRFLSMDPFVQMPDFSQNFNRYSYALNNPLKYTDPDGEVIVFDSWISGFFRGLFQGKNPLTTASQSALNDIKIWRGLFESDPNKNFGGRLWEVVSRFTWQLPQTLAGFTFSQVSNLGWQVDKVNYSGGATVLSGNFFGSDGAVTLGSYINGSRSLVADPHTSLFQHEYGHYLQSQAMGWAYLSRVGIPSLMGAAKYDDGNHKYQPYEQDANRRAFMYFNDPKNKIEGLFGFYTSEERYIEQRDNRSYFNGTSKGWNFYSNPLDVNHTTTSGIYYDYHNQAHRDLINSLSLHAKWYDYLDPTGIIVGTGNGIYYNKRRVR